MSAILSDKDIAILIKDFNVSEEDKKLNRSFYPGGI